jgi:carbon-monoxide dehydrogenase large subunit
MATGTVERLVGKAIRRREDPRFLTGRGTFTDDVRLPGTQHSFFVRSSLAHARIRRIDSSRALAQPGVRAVFTGRDLADAGVNPIPVGWLLPGLKTTDFRAIAVDVVRHVGEAVAVVVAESAAIARDAAELVEVEYEELPVVVDALAALRPGAPQVHATAPDNRCFHWEIGDRGKTEAALHGASRVVRTRLVNQRLIANAIEPRASLASYQAASDELTLWVTSQNPHVHRLIMGAFVLGLPEQKFRVIAPDVGGAFGSKIFIYPEEVAVAWLSRRLGVPVRWTAERSESFLTDAQGRDHVSEVEMGFDARGKLAGLRVKTVANLGAYLTLFAPAIPTYLYGTLLNGVYDIPSIFCEVDGVFTHTVPVDAYRGAGRPEACYLLERTMDLAARELGVDPADLRRRNLIPKERFPFQTQVAVTYDSGTRAGAGARAADGGLRALPRRAGRGAQEGRYFGLGLSCYIEACGLAPSGGGLARCPGRPLQRRHRPGAPHREGDRAHRLAQPRPGTRDHLRPAGGGHPRHPAHRRGHRARGHRAHPLRDGQLRQPERGGGRRGHSPEPAEGHREGPRARRPPARGGAG